MASDLRSRCLSTEGVCSLRSTDAISSNRCARVSGAAIYPV